MVHNCCCFGCKEKYVKGRNITFHSFPTDESKKKLWLQKIRRENFVPTKYSKVCSKHFTEECFDREKFGGVWLKPDAVPTIFAFPKHLMPKVFFRKPPTKRTSAGPVNNLHDSTIQEQSIEIKFEDVTAVPLSSSVDNTSLKKSTVKHYRYVGDFNEEEMISPSKAKKALFIAKKQISAQRKKLVQLRSKIAKQKKTILRLSSLLEELVQKRNVSDDVCHILEMSLPGTSWKKVK